MSELGFVVRIVSPNVERKLKLEESVTLMPVDFGVETNH